MNLNDLSQQSACAILQTLVDQQILTEEMLLEMLESNPSNEMKRLVDIVHRMFCSEVHPAPEVIAEGNWQGAYCAYEAEEFFDEAWSLPFHRSWLRKTLSLMREIGTPTETHFHRALADANPLVIKLTQMEQEKPAAYALALKVKRLVQELNTPTEED